MIAKTIAVAMTAFLLTGCGAIMHGTRQAIEVQSSPSGAKVQTSPEGGTYTTPTTLNLERKNDYVLTFTSPGYAPATLNIHKGIGGGTVIADVLLGGLLGVIVDGITGAWYGLSPESAVVTLLKNGNGDGPEEIHVSFGRQPNGDAATVGSDAAKVTVKVERK
jgi:hypothetical protein